MKKLNIIILGAGIAGLGAAFQLARRGLAHVTVLEQNDCVGGNAGSFELDGISVDYGSHRLHPSCDPEILQDLKSLLKDDLLIRPRHGRIRLQGRWIHFPLKPLDLLFRLHPAFSLGVVKDMFSKVIPKGSDTNDDFRSVLKRGLGSTICHDFYFPYAVKMWGVSPGKLSAIQAKKRISASSLSKMLRKIITSVPGLKTQMTGRFYYPRKGFGQIASSLFDACKAMDVKFYFSTHIKSINPDFSGNKKGNEVLFARDDKAHILSADYVWSTIPVTSMVNYICPHAPEAVLEASKKLSYRAMVIIYLVLKQKQFSEYDAHYFPEIEIPFTRLSEPKNYSNSYQDLEKTVLCAELPCSMDDVVWKLSDKELGEIVLDGLEKAKIPVTTKVESVTSRRIQYAYPIYEKGYEKYFNLIDQWIDKIHGLLSLGRQGLFAHDNTHHALSMAYAAVDCLENNHGCFDYRKWNQYRQVFQDHVVED